MPTSIPYGPAPSGYTPPTDSPSVSEKSDAALRQVAKYAVDPARQFAAEDELRRRAAAAAAKRKEEREKREREAQEKQIRERAKAKHVERHGVVPSEEQLQETVAYLMDTDPEGEKLGAAHGDRYLPDDLAAKRQRERARRSD